MDMTHDVVSRELMAQSQGLASRISRDRIASLERIIAVGLAAGLPLDDIRDGIARQRGVLLAGSRERAPIAWSDAIERDFCSAFDAVRKSVAVPGRRVLVTTPIEESV